MSAGEVMSIAAAGLAAGTINTVVGSGTLITFPVLLALWLCAGDGERLQHDRPGPGLGLGRGRLSARARRTAAGARSGWGRCRCSAGVTGAVLLLVLPASAFEAIVPVFIALALVLTVLQPRLNRWLAAPRDRRSSSARGPCSRCSSTSTGVYGGYFGAAQGILLLAILGVACAQSLQRTNALKNVLAGLVNGVAGVYFVFAAHVDWGPAAIIAASSILGAQLGARYGRRLSPALLRAVIVLVGVSAIVRLRAT